jgi:5S rRNA maturation endonuclease (ribonuclease M5)
MKNKQIDEEQLDEVIRGLEDKLIIVEGKMDKKALKTLGLKDIIAINGRPLYEVAEVALSAKKQVVILTDFDTKGREIAKKLKYLLQRQGKSPNSELRWKVMTLGKNKIEDFGALNSPDSLSLEEDVHVKTRANVDKIRCKGRNRRSGSNRKT